MKIQWLAATIVAMQIQVAVAGEQGVHTEILARSTTSWDGETFQYPQGKAEISVVRITIPAGSTLPWHCHPVPLGGVVTQGRLKVSKPDGASTWVEAGQGLVEVSRQWHRGFAEEDVEIIVVYAGAEGVPLGFGQDADAELTALCR
jgi:quercetin dioxygenase-like cupin family protein